MNNLLKRGKIYHVRYQVNGVIKTRSLKTGNLEEARPRAREIIKTAQKQGFNASPVEKSKPTRPSITITELCATYREAAAARRRRKGKPRERTVQTNINQIHNLIRTATDLDATGYTTDILTPDTLDRYADKLTARYDDTYEHQVRARTTGHSTIQHVKSLFAQWSLEYYETQGISLVDIDAFMKHQAIEPPDSKYTFPPIPLVEATEQASKELQRDRSPLYGAFLLCHDLGLRAGAAAAARWDWIEHTDNGRFLHIPNSNVFQTKSKSYRIRINEHTWEQLINLDTFGQDHILPATVDRYTLITEDLCEWMRGIGWDHAHYSKGAHELRKLAGARWYTHHGLQVAAEWLGDHPNTVYRFYADLDPRNHPEPAMA